MRISVGLIDAFAPLERLSSLVLYSNHFGSSIQARLLFNFTGEIFVDFGHNNFTGTLPPNFARWAANISESWGCCITVTAATSEEMALLRLLCRFTRLSSFSLPVNNEERF